MSINSISMKNYRMCQNSSNPYRYRNSTLLVPKNLNIESNSTLVDTNQTSKNITQPRLSLQPQQDSVSFSSREKIVAKGVELKGGDMVTVAQDTEDGDTLSTSVGVAYIQGK